MPTRLPRLNVVIEKPLYEAVSRLAKRDGLSRSLKARDLLREALETDEDAYWTRRAQARERTFSSGKALTVSAARRRLGLRSSR